MSTGGVISPEKPTGSWTSVGDAALRSALSSPDGAEHIGTEDGKNLQQVIKGKQGLFSISLIENGGIDNKTADNTSKIQQLINLSENAILMIERDCLWHPSLIKFKDNVTVIDYSGWDDKYKKWTSQIRHFLDTDQPQTKNANEYIITSRHHPALVLDNYGGPGDPEGPERRASVIFRYQGALAARMGIGALDGDTTFILADNKLGTRLSFLNTNEGDFEFSLGGLPVVGVDYTHQSKRDADQIHRKIPRTGFGVVEQYYSGAGVISSQVTFAPDGSISYKQKDTNTLTISASGEVSGGRKLILANTSKSLVRTESGSVLVNAPGTATSGYVLPVGGEQTGVYFEAINTTGVRLTISTRGGESFIDGSTMKEIVTRGAQVSVIYLGSGLWHLSTLQ